MSSKVTSLEVAEMAGVSRSAVSRVFTPGASASPKTIEKVRRAAEVLGYRPNTLARAMKSGRSRIIGVIMADLENEFYATALDKLSRTLQAQGYHVLVLLAGNEEGAIAPILQSLLDYQVDGIVTASVAMSNELTTICDTADIPVVMFNRGQDDVRLSSVTTDNVAGAQLIAQFLLAGDHKRIAHISGWQGSSTGRDRTRSFLATLAEQGLEPVAVADGHYSSDRAAELTREMFLAPNPPDAVFVGNDHMAFAVMDVLRFELGLRVPQDVSVVGYDDVPMAARPVYDLTTIRQPINRMIDATVDRLLARIEGHKDPQQETIPGALQLRGSARKPNSFLAER